MSGSFAPSRKSTTDDGDKNFWATSWKCFNDAQSLYGRPFLHDVAAEPQTAKCASFYSLQLGLDSLVLDWPEHWWCNPPFDQKVAFIRRAAEQNKPGMMLLPYEPLTKWWQNNIPNNVIIYEPDGRYGFLERDGVTEKRGVNFSSAFVLFTCHHFDEPLRVRFKRGIAKART